MYEQGKSVNPAPRLGAVEGEGPAMLGDGYNHPTTTTTTTSAALPTRLEAVVDRLRTNLLDLGSIEARLAVTADRVLGAEPTPAGCGDKEPDSEGAQAFLF